MNRLLLAGNDEDNNRWQCKIVISIRIINCIGKQINFVCVAWHVGIVGLQYQSAAEQSMSAIADNINFPIPN